MPAVFPPWETGTRAHSQLLFLSTFPAPWKPNAEPCAAYLGAGWAGFEAFLKSPLATLVQQNSAKNFSNGDAEIKFWQQFPLSLST